MTPSVEKCLSECLRDNEYLRGDDCQSTRRYLCGWIGAQVWRTEGRAGPRDFTAEETTYITAQLDAFLRAGSRPRKETS